MLSNEHVSKPPRMLRYVGVDGVSWEFDGLLFDDTRKMFFAVFGWMVRGGDIDFKDKRTAKMFVLVTNQLLPGTMDIAGL